MIQKIITCAGYYGSGSSAITDLLRELDNCTSIDDYEFRFIQDPNGLRDLDYNLVENNHRHNSSHAIKKYMKLCKFLNGSKIIKRYNRYFDNHFKKCTDTFLKQIIELETKSMWHVDVIEKGKLFYLFDRTFNKIYKKVFHINKDKYGVNFLKNEKAYFSYPCNKFYDFAKEYTNNLFSYLNKENKEFLMIDQLVPVSNIEPYLNYFYDIKIVCVNRDPRDLYLLEKLFWKSKTIPTRNVEDFCKWYELTRRHLNYEKENEKVLRIYFEDLIYKYDQTVDKILNFLNIDSSKHIKKNTYFKKDESINSTKLFLKHRNYETDIEYIEKNLKEYLYKY